MIKEHRITICALITGTNAVGKSSVAKEIISRFGGISNENDSVTYLRDGGVCLAGRYVTRIYGGVDSLVDSRGRSCTSVLADVVQRGLQNADVIICEGSRVNTFGMNVLNALFKAKRQIVLNLYADKKTLFKRLVERSGACQKRNFGAILKGQRASMLAARKFQSVGVPVLQYNTAEYTAAQIADALLNKIEEIKEKK